jgi:vitamin B12 transporter
MPALPIYSDQIVITTSRAPEAQSSTAASVTIIDRNRIDRLGEPLVLGLLRLTPSTSVTTIGPSGSLTEVRIRGAEANHSLFFVDGIKINDPASGDAPRFELLNADLASRIEIVRGPQSALWGSDAIGGVIAVNGLEDSPGHAISGEGGSFGFRRASGTGSIAAGAARLSGAIGWQRATGIDSFGAAGGDKDGYRNLSGRVHGTYALGSNVRIGASTLALTGRSEFDGYRITFPFDHADTPDSSRNRLAAGRVWAEFGTRQSPWAGRLSASRLGSTNHNYLDGNSINRTSGTRRTLDAQLEHGFSTGALDQRLILAAEAEHETFEARDSIYGGFTNQDRDRSHRALTAEWRASVKAIEADVAVRRDIFNRFRDATSVRASLLGDIGSGLRLTGAYAEGIAQPTFFDLYGFFPGNFTGNPSLKAESSRGFEAGIHYRRKAFTGALTGYRQRLYDEIMDVGDPDTFLRTTINLDQTSHRSGIEAEAAWHFGDKLRVTANYAYLHAIEPDNASGRPVTEHRRPKHSGSIAADGKVRRWTYGVSIAHVGAQLDTRDNYPYDVVRLGSYWLAGARVAYAVTRGIELYARGSNLFDAKYENSVGYHTEGRGLFIGLRLADPRSLP